MRDRYEPSAFEPTWRQRWKDADLFVTREEEGRPKFFGLDFFPFPSGAGLSVGHCRNYVPTDVLCRMKYMQGFNVLHPMGFDAFGLPAENEAIKRQSHPAPMIAQYADNYHRQMDLIGVSYDWDRSFKSSDPDYYRWTQWIFELLYKQGLAYRKQAAVNWDPVDKTVLADEEVIAGRAERSGALVEKRYIYQWFFKITEFAQRLIDDLDTVDWPDGIKHQQRNWIGRSEGVQFTMKLDLRTQHEIESSVELARERTPHFEVFTTRIDTIYGMTFCVLAPEHPMVETIKGAVGQEFVDSINAYQQKASALSDTDRLAEDCEKTGAFTGAYAINPANGKRVPVYIADYVLATYGTGAIMAVPAHDERDYAFATKFGIDIVPVIVENPGDPTPELPFSSKTGVLVNSGEYSGLRVPKAINAMGEWIEALGIGERKVQYKLRDWLISRQRYWGCPIPVIHHADGSEELVAESLLPVELPDVESYEPSGDGSSPLSGIPEFVNVIASDGRMAQRETDTMGGFACSSWYFLRFCDPHNHKRAWDLDKVSYWMPVDCYVGGAEHAVMHLLYARFWMKALYDEKLVPVNEPFQRLMNQGQVLAYTPYRKPRADEKLGVGEDGILVSFDEAKTLPESELTWKWVRMSKSKGNVVTPDEVVESHGADALRIYLLFVAPFTQDVEWSYDGLNGAVRFLNRVFKVVAENVDRFDIEWQENIATADLSKADKDLRRATHQAIKKVTDDIDRFAFNTAIAALMTYLNTLTDAMKGTVHPLVLSEALESLVLLLAPIAPHSADELWDGLGYGNFTYQADWPKDDEALAKDESVTIAVQVNGKLRDTMDMPLGLGVKELEDAALKLEKVLLYTQGKEIKKVVVVPNKLVSIVVA